VPNVLASSERAKSTRLPSRATLPMNAPSQDHRTSNPSAESRTSEPTQVAEGGASETLPPGGPFPAARPPKRAKARRVLVGLLLGAVLLGGAIWVVRRGRESTDDAQVEGHVVMVSVRTPGQVGKVMVTDNQQVRQGDVLIELDLEELKARLGVAHADRMAAEASLALAQAQLSLTQRTSAAGIRQARGGVYQATSGVASGRAQVDQAQADVQVAQSRDTLAAKDVERVRQLFAEGGVSQAELDTRQAAADQSHAGLELARARLVATRALISGNYGGVEQAEGRLVAALAAPQQVEAAEAQVKLGEARLQQARATEHLAELNLSYGVVKAPVAGVVSRKNVEIGSLVSPDRPVMALIPLDDVWVVANFKEDQLGSMKVGQPASIDVDTFPGQTLPGSVESVAAGTGARFALLPPDNATGNFVKVVQRVPVRIRLSDRRSLSLRPGMSATVTVRLK
jgi:membrane fusion protein, multidrug efflux system